MLLRWCIAFAPTASLPDQTLTLTFATLNTQTHKTHSPEPTNPNSKLKTQTQTRQAHNADRPVADFCLDADLDAEFKESWCKKGPVSDALLRSYRRQPPLPPPHAVAPPPPAPAPEELAPLTAAADVIGAQLQNRHQGFLPNRRQQRAAGYAAIELAQALQALLAERRRGSAGLWTNSAGASGQGGCAGRHLFGWRDAADAAVRWRQLAEPSDQVVWVDMLTRREFEAGFGSHTPMFTGQTKCVRYYMNFARAFDLFKALALEGGRAFDAANRPIALGADDKREAVARARTAWELYEVIGWVVIRDKGRERERRGGRWGTGVEERRAAAWCIARRKAGLAAPFQKARPETHKKHKHQTPNTHSADSWVVVPLESAATPGATLEGTRLTLVRVPGQPEGVEFSIRTPVTPPRWRAFDAELEAAWERLVGAALAGDRPATARAILEVGPFDGGVKVLGGEGRRDCFLFAVPCAHQNPAPTHSDNMH